MLDTSREEIIGERRRGWEERDEEESKLINTSTKTKQKYSLAL